MAAGRFEFFPYREEDVVTIGRDRLPILRPTVDISIEREGLTATVTALVDTGAPYTLFARGVGDMLDVDFSDSTAMRRDHFIGGGRRTAQMEHVSLGLVPFDGLEWETEVSFFVDDWQLPFAGVLGHAGFLDRWVVSFNYSENYFVVEEPQAFGDRLPPDYSRVFEERDTGWRSR